jgi:hypothetical protein
VSSTLMFFILPVTTWSTICEYWES